MALGLVSLIVIAVVLLGGLAVIGFIVASLFKSGDGKSKPTVIGIVLGLGLLFVICMGVPAVMFGLYFSQAEVQEAHRREAIQQNLDEMEEALEKVENEKAIEEYLEKNKSAPGQIPVDPERLPEKDEEG